MVTEFVEVVAWVQVDEDGDWSVAKDRDDLDGTTGAVRVVKVVLKVPKPLPVELVCEVPEEEPVAGLKLA